MPRTYVSIQGELVYTAYDKPFSMYYRSNWMQGPWTVQPDDREWKALVHLRDGNVLTKTVTLP